MSGNHPEGPNVSLAASAGDVVAPSSPPTLRGKMGTAQLVLTVLAMSSPLGAVAGVMPLVIKDGNGAGAPLTYAFIGLVMLLFAVGFTTMTRNFPRAGAFYAYITGGLGRVAGLPAAFIAQLGYLTLLMGSYAFFGDLAVTLQNSLFGAEILPWWAWGGLLWVAVTVLGHFNVELSGRLLSVVMVVEVIIVLVFNVSVGATGGPHGLQVESFSSSAFGSGSLGVAILLASSSFLGFEASAIYRSEVKNPQRTVPRATYLGVIFIAIFYVFSSWALVTFYGVDGVSGAAQADSTGMFAAGLQFYAGPVMAEIMRVMVVSSMFAATLAAHNPLARYTFALARDGVLPKFLAKVHSKHRSPAVASAVTSSVALGLTMPFLFAGLDAVTFYSWMFGLGAYALLVLMAATCLAVLVYFRRVQHSERLWNTMIAPALGLAGLVVMLVIGSIYFPTLVGGDVFLAWVLQLLIVGLAVTGVGLALRWRRTRPHVYASIGGEAGCAQDPKEIDPGATEEAPLQPTH